MIFGQDLRIKVGATLKRFDKPFTIDHGAALRSQYEALLKSA